MSLLALVPDGAPLQDHLTRAGFALYEASGEYDVWLRENVMVWVTIASKDTSDLWIAIRHHAGGVWHLYDHPTPVRPANAIGILDGLVRKHYAAALALLLPGPERSPNTESTAAPWWAILDPGRGRTRNVGDIAGAITGPFLTRAVAQDHLDEQRHNYGPHAVVYGLSGDASPEWCALPVAPKAGQ